MLPLVCDNGKNIKEAIGNDFVLLKQEHLLEMTMLIFIRPNIKPYISKVQRITEATGAMNMLGNKGGLAVFMQINFPGFEEERLIFVSSHLAAHQDLKFIRKRNQDVKNIMKGARLQIENLDMYAVAHHLVWFGDLNYRVDLALLNEMHRKLSLIHHQHWTAVQKLVQEKKYNVLYSADQLRNEVPFSCLTLLTAWQMKQNRVFVGFREVPPSFPPTFKVVRKEYNTYLEQRIPSYCDRILWHSHPGRSHLLRQTVFKSVPEVDTSDHKPIYAQFELQKIAASARPKTVALNLIFRNVRYTFSHDKVDISLLRVLGVGVL